MRSFPRSAIARWARPGLALLAIQWVASPCRSQNLPDGFAVQAVVLEPFASLPVGFTFLPDGRILIIEKNSGNVRLAPTGGISSVVIATIPGLTTQSERGLLGVAVDPAWPVRPYVYFQSTHTDTTSHITMYQASGDLTNPASTSVSLGNPYILLKDRDQYEHHNGGTLRFGPDGCLYSSLGDDGYTCQVQDLAFLNGKILRLDVSNMPGTGTGPPPKSAITPDDNPFPGPSDNARLVFARGLRNPWRFTIDPPTHDLYIGDVGDLSWEELDVVSFDGYVGNNYGWPELEGFVPNPCCPTCTSIRPYTDPIHVYPNPPDPLSAAVTGGPLYRRVLGSPYSFGFEYDGSLFFGDSAARWLRRVVRSGEEWIVPAPVPGQPDALNWATNLASIVDLQQGVDGALYFMAFPGGALARGLYRLVPNQPVDLALPHEGPRLHCYPNPTSAWIGTTFEYRCDRQECARLRIYDVAGGLVRVLQSPGVTASASSRLHWDGRTRSGHAAPAGVYVVRLDTASGEQAHGRLTLLR